MNIDFLPRCRCLLICSFPVSDHEKAGDMVIAYSPDIPVWAQLPANPVEGMIPQFLPGLPGVVKRDGRSFVDTQGDSFHRELVEFYEQFMAVAEGSKSMDTSIFALNPADARGFFVFIENIRDLPVPPFALKGQITGPFTFATGVTDQDKRAIFYDDQLRDAAVKLLACKAAWQLIQLAEFDVPKIIFIDEPALAGFGSSEFTSISRQDVMACLEEVISAVHDRGGLAGIHVCANTDWSLILESSVDIVNFDAYTYFDRFVLYGEAIQKFIQNGGILAWGIVPTLLAEDIDRETAASLADQLTGQMASLVELGISKETLLAQSIISPSCGLGSLDLKRAIKVLELTRDVSRALRNTI
jgi:methionine synthase II (cobalamin-independent)